jgi:predicted RNase H-like HicB family nuclease
VELAGRLEHGVGGRVVQALHAEESVYAVTGDYHINIFWSTEDGGYNADIPDLASCSAFGVTPAEALEQVLIAKQAWLHAARELGKPIPAPRYRPAIYQASG